MVNETDVVVIGAKVGMVVVDVVLAPTNVVGKIDVDIDDDGDAVIGKETSIDGIILVVVKIAVVIVEDGFVTEDFVDVGVDGEQIRLLENCHFD